MTKKNDAFISESGTDDGAVSMALHIDPKTNMHYIYNSKSKIALSYMYDEEYEDVVLDYYGIREWVESLPQKKSQFCYYKLPIR